MITFTLLHLKWSSDINETNEMSGSKSLFVELTFNTIKYKIITCFRYSKNECIYNSK